MVFQYKRVLLVGATAGIGAAMADRLIQEGAKVIAVGRRQERIDAFIKKHGSDKASGIRYDVTDKAGLEAFVENVVQTYPDLDCVFLNSGVQSQVILNKPESVDLDAFHREIDVNFTSIVNLSIKFLPHLLKKDYPASVIITGTLLSLIPAVLMPAYSASKAALKAYTDCLQLQYRDTNVKILELVPPAVQTELHDYIGIEHGRAIGMPLAEFTEQAYAGLAAGKDEVIIGGIIGGHREAIDSILNTRRELFENISKMLLAMMAQKP